MWAEPAETVESAGGGGGGGEDAASPPTCVMNKSQLLTQHLHPSFPTETIRDTFWFHPPLRGHFYLQNLYEADRNHLSLRTCPSAWGQSVCSCQRAAPMDPQRNLVPQWTIKLQVLRGAVASTRASMENVLDDVLLVCVDAWRSTSALR